MSPPRRSRSAPWRPCRPRRPSGRATRPHRCRGVRLTRPSPRRAGPLARRSGRPAWLTSRPWLLTEFRSPRWMPIGAPRPTPTRPVDSPGRCWPRSGGWNPITGGLPARSCTATAYPLRRSSASGSTAPAAWSCETPTVGASTATPPMTVRSVPCSSSRRRGRPTGRTAMATAALIRSIFTTRPPPPRATSAGPAETCGRPPASNGRCGRTTPRRATWLKCSHSRRLMPPARASWFRCRRP
jgi:hypothetical protein